MIDVKNLKNSNYIFFKLYIYVKDFLNENISMSGLRIYIVLLFKVSCYLCKRLIVIVLIGKGWYY